MEGNLLVSKEENIKTLIRIDKILNYRFEREKRLYLDKQLKYEIRKKIANGQWQGIAQGVMKTEKIAEKILVNEILNNAWLVNKKISERDYRNYVKPLLDSCDNETYCNGMKKILENRIEVREDFKIILLKTYYEKKTKEELIELINKKDKHLDKEEICIDVLNKIITEDGEIEEKVKCLLEAYEGYKKLRKCYSDLEGLWKVILNENSELGVRVIMENYIKKCDFNEEFWIKIMAIKQNQAIQEIEKFAGSSEFDRFTFRSLLRGVHNKLLNNKNAEEIIKAADSLVRIVKLSTINGDIYRECRNLIKNYKKNYELKERLEKIISEYSHCYQWRNHRTSTGIKEVDVCEGNKAGKDKIYNFFRELIKLDLDKRKKVRLAHFNREYENFNEEKKEVERILIENHSIRNCEELIFYLIEEGNSATSNKIADLVIEKCNLDWELEEKVIENAKEKYIKNKKIMKFIHREDFDLFKEIYGRKI